MSRDPMNLLVLMADEHSRAIAGCYGHPFARTPNLDALAHRGARFTDAYSNSPICIPSRASFATGRYVHDIGNWDNVHPYAGAHESWAHRVRAAGMKAVSIGKLHYRNEHDDTGFSEQIIPMHTADDGIGDLIGLLRDPLPPSRKSSKMAQKLGPGESTYTKYDRDIADNACRWLEDHGKAGPWVLFVSFVCPHHPLIAPQEFFDLYADVDIPPPKAGQDSGVPLHPWIAALHATKNDDDFLTPETRRQAMANYYGLVSFADRNIGRVLDALEGAGLSGNTRILYTSDHGENLGARRLWGKNNMYEESAGVPLVLAGPDVAAGVTIRTPASLIDMFPSVLEAVGIAPAPQDSALPGTSLWGLADAAPDPERVIFSEYHAIGSPSAAYMLRRGSKKLIHYVGFAAELFDLSNDPEEIKNLIGTPEGDAAAMELGAVLRGITDPEATDAKAKQAQQVLIDEFGGYDAIASRGKMQGTPAPGEKASFAQ